MDPCGENNSGHPMCVILMLLSMNVSNEKMLEASNKSRRDTRQVEYSQILTCLD